MKLTYYSQLTLKTHFYFIFPKFLAPKFGRKRLIHKELESKTEGKAERGVRAEREERG